MRMCGVRIATCMDADNLQCVYSRMFLLRCLSHSIHPQQRKPNIYTSDTIRRRKSGRTAKTGPSSETPNHGTLEPLNP